MPSIEIYYTIMKANSICIKKGILNYPNLWIFLDEDRVSDEILFLKSIPATRQLGIIVRTKNKKYL